MTCPYQHTEKTDGQWRRGDNCQFGIVAKSNGQLEVKARCLNCGAKSGAIPGRLVRDWGITGSDLDVLTIHEARTDYPPCSVRGCLTQVTELHHFAPRNTFGAEADDWPVHALCRAHHVEWHQRMDGYLWHASHPSRVREVAS